MFSFSSFIIYPMQSTLGSSIFYFYLRVNFLGKYGLIFLTVATVKQDSKKGLNRFQQRILFFTKQLRVSSVYWNIQRSHTIDWSVMYIIMSYVRTVHSRVVFFSSCLQLHLEYFYLWTSLSFSTLYCEYMPYCARVFEFLILRQFNLHRWIGFHD